MNHQIRYEEWLNSDNIDENIKNELILLKDNIDEIEDRFYTDLEFGTGGMRGKIGAGTNRINIHTVGKVTQGLADYLIENTTKDKVSVVIAYDSRYKSDDFAQYAAEVLAANNIKVYLFEDLRSTPELSFAVRRLKCSAGIVITASHNPSEYNGYKVYGSDGGQLIPQVANELIEKVKQVDYKDVKNISNEQKSLISIIGEKIDKEYIEKIKELSVNDDIDKNINIVYTPLHGTGYMPVTRVLDELGYKNVSVVKEQQDPDPDFSTVESPNPEEKSAFKLAIELAKKKDADIVLGTDPDCDRVGLVVKNADGEYTVLNGNQTGALLVDYILKSLDKKNQIPSNGIIIKTIVTSEIGREIAKNYGVECIDTLTGFKFIGEKIKKFEETKDKKFIFGYEESFGYLAGTFVRDKDAVIASMLACEMVAYYKKKGKTLYEALQGMYQEYGYYIEETNSIKLEGSLGRKKIEKIMDYFRDHKTNQIMDEIVPFASDYEMQLKYNLSNGDFEKITLPKAKVHKFELENNSWYVLRPSGTEPKLKIYFSMKGRTLEEATQRLEKVKREIMKMIESVV